MWSLLGGWLLGAVTLASAGPITYDQRQEGPLNVHVQLDNLAVLLVPTGSLMDASWVTQLANSAMGRTPGGQTKDQANQISSTFKLVPESAQSLLSQAPVPSKVFEGPPEGVPTPQLSEALNASKTDAMEPVKRKDTPASTTLLAESAPVSLTLSTKQVLTSPQVLPESETPSRDALETGLRRP